MEFLLGTNMQKDNAIVFDLQAHCYLDTKQCPIVVQHDFLLLRYLVTIFHISSVFENGVEPSQKQNRDKPLNENASLN